MRSLRLLGRHGAGDVNGDGYADVDRRQRLLFDNGQTDEGRSSSTTARRPGSRHPRLDRGERIRPAPASALGGDGGRRERRRLLRRHRRRRCAIRRTASTDEGRAFVYLRLGRLVSPRPGMDAESDQAERASASRSATAGDVNGDGYSDVDRRRPCLRQRRTIDEGRAYRLPRARRAGSPRRPPGRPRSNQDRRWFGASVATAGDVNGDGYSDVIVGALDYDNGHSGRGPRLRLPRLAPPGLAASPPGRRRRIRTTPFRGSVASAGT